MYNNKSTVLKKKHRNKSVGGRYCGQYDSGCARSHESYCPRHSQFTATSALCEAPHPQNNALNRGANRFMNKHKGILILNRTPLSSPLLAGSHCATAVHCDSNPQITLSKSPTIANCSYEIASATSALPKGCVAARSCPESWESSCCAPACTAEDAALVSWAMTVAASAPLRRR